MKKEELKIGGFTLVEIIVSVSIFTVVMLVTMGALLTLNDASRKAQALRTVIDNLNFSLEDMARKIRTGSYYQCFESGPGSDDVLSQDNITKGAKDCPGNPGHAILLQTQEVVDTAQLWVVYAFYRDPITGKGGIFLRSGKQNGATTVQLEGEKLAITSPEVDIKRAEFRIVGAEKKTPKTKPMVIINISGTVNLSKEKLQTDFSLQTAISQRGFDE